MDGVVAGTPEARFTTAGSRAHARWRDREPVSAPSGTWADFWRPASLRGASGVRPTSGYAVQVADLGDDVEQVGSPVGHRVLARSGGQVDQGPEVGRAGQVERLRRGAAPALAPRGQHPSDVRRVAVEAQQVAEVGGRM